MCNSFISNLLENQYLRKLRKIQAQIKDKETYVNQLRSPVYQGETIMDVREFADNFARVASGMMSPEEFAARCINNRRYTKEEMFEYLDKLGQYLIIFADYEHKAVAVLEELNELRQEEQKLKQQLQIR